MVSLEIVNGTPVFVVHSTDPNYGRIHGSSFDKEAKLWRFAAYPPFGSLVIADLKKVFPATVFTAEASQQIELLNAIPQRLKDRNLPTEFGFKTKPFDHQIEGLTYLLNHPRFALFWDPGTGKSKVIVDLKRCRPKNRMLIVTPKVTVMNWVKEFLTHGESDIRVGAIRGTPEQKRRILERYKEYDVLVTTYGTARNMGLPVLHKETLKQIRAAQKLGVKLSESGLLHLIRSIRVLGDPDRQMMYVFAWAMGTPLTHIEKYAKAEAALKAQFLEDIDYETIVCDESQNIKESSSQQTKTVIALSKQFGFRYLMSGTPTMGDPRHLFPQMKFLSPAIIPEDWLKFSDMYLTRSPYNKRMVTGFKNMNILNSRVDRVAIRKKKEECLDLPPRKIIDMTFELSPEQKGLYNTLITQMGADLQAFFADPQGAMLEIQNAAVLLGKLAQVSSGFLLDNQKDSEICNGCPHLAKCVIEGISPYTKQCQVVQVPPPSKVNHCKVNPKLELLEDLLDTLLADDSHKVIIWGVHKAELQNIADLLDKKKWPYVRVDGSTGGNIQTLVDKFNADPKWRVYLGQIATGVGITLNAAAYTIYDSLDWSLGTYEQSIDRNYRAGQTNSTFVYRLLALDTIDMYKARVLDEKKTISATLTNKLACATCVHQMACLTKKIELFDPGCIYQRTAKRTVAHAKEIT